jgi:peptide/nickel transport system substrate-binding protein
MRRAARVRWAMASGLCVAASLVLAACGSSPTGAGGSSPKYLIIGTDGGIDSLNPFVGLNQDSFNSWEQIYPQLVQYNPRTLAFEPDFATAWSSSDGGLRWTFHTVANAKWSDGTPLTAADVAWTYNTIIKFQAGPTAALAGAVKDVRRVVAQGPNTVVVEYRTPVANVLSDLQQVPILPQHVWGRYAAGNGKGMKTYANTPAAGKPLVSGGPFELIKYVLNQTAAFRANPNWYGPKPRIQGFVLQVFSNDDAMVSALKTGQVDAVEGVPVTAVRAVKSAGMHLYVGPSFTWRDLIINPNPAKTTHRELLNPLVRKAFEYAVDRRAIVNTAWLGYAQPGSVDVPPADGIWHDSQIKPLPYSIAQANKLLDQAGYKRGAGGVRVADGHPMSYQVIFSTDQNGPGDRAFQIIKTDFAKIGVRLSQHVLDPSATFTAITANRYRNFDLAMWYWVPIVDPDFMMSAYTCAQYDAWNDSGYCNRTYDRLYAKQAVTLNQNARKAIIYRMEKMVYDSRSEIVLVNNDTIDAWSPKWTGFIESPQGFFTQLSKASLESVHPT